MCDILDGSFILSILSFHHQGGCMSFWCTSDRVSGPWPGCMAVCLPPFGALSCMCHCPHSKTVVRFGDVGELHTFQWLQFSQLMIPPRLEITNTCLPMHMFARRSTPFILKVFRHYAVCDGIQHITLHHHLHFMSFSLSEHPHTAMRWHHAESCSQQSCRFHRRRPSTAAASAAELQRQGIAISSCPCPALDPVRIARVQS